MATTKKAKKFEANAKVPVKAVKAAKPAKAAKEAAGPRKSSPYRLINAAKKIWEAYGGQKGAIVKALVKAGAVGAKAAGVTSGELQAALPDVPAKNVSFYLSVLQKTEPAVLEKLEPVA